MADDHNEVINQITLREFGTPAGSIRRMTNGICNDVYLVATGGRDVVVRVNAEPRFMLGSHEHIPLFRSKDISVPEILAEDFTRSVFPLAYQILSRIDGRDIGDVIDTLSDDQLRAIGGEITNIFRQLSTVPNNGKFGVLWGDDKDLVDSWSSEVARVTKVVIGWGTNTGVIDDELREILAWINAEYKGYFDSVRPYTYFGDLSAKNVMVHDGRFTGLVDLDSLAQGDPLEAIGRIKASWYGTHHGQVYSDAMMDALSLSDAQRKIVTMYALLNKVFWTLENGVQFNRNTRRTVDAVRMNQDKAVVSALNAELHAAEPPLTFEPEKPAVKPKTRKPTVVENALLNEGVVVEPAIAPPPEEAAAESIAPALVDQPIIEPVVPVIDDVPAVPTRRPSTQKALLEASGLSKTYISDGIGFDALKNVDLRIERGDCVAIVGKSGSGKSTLMHMLACLDVPSAGYVYVDGDETTTMAEAEKNRLRNEKFGFVFQQFFLNGRDTVFENVVLPMRIRGATDFDMITDSDEALGAVGLADKTEKRAKDLSGGEKQRVCIARALVGKPQVIFADEPTGNLDSNTGAAVEKLLFDLNRDKGITLVIVTHDPDLAKRCGRVVEMKDGQIVAERVAEAAS